MVSVSASETVNPKEGAHWNDNCDHLRNAIPGSRNEFRVVCMKHPPDRFFCSPRSHGGYVALYPPSLACLSLLPPLLLPHRVGSHLFIHTGSTTEPLSQRLAPMLFKIPLLWCCVWWLNRLAPTQMWSRMWFCCCPLAYTVTWLHRLVGKCPKARRFLVDKGLSTEPEARILAAHPAPRGTSPNIRRHP